MRRFPLKMETLIENLVDPAHVQFSHHGTSEGNRRLTTRQMTMRVDAREPAEGNLSAVVNLLLGDSGVTKPFIRVSLRSGTLVWYDLLTSRRGGFGSGLDLMLYVTPSEKKMTTVFLMRFMYDPPWFYKTFRPRVPLWIDHAQNNLTFDGDTPFLQWQEGIVRLAKTDTRAKTKLMRGVNDNANNDSQEDSDAAATGSGVHNGINNNNNRANGTWRDAYVMSTSTHDCLVADFRKWNDVTSRIMPFPLTTSFEDKDDHIIFLDERDINDRYKWHTKDCLACSGALRNLRVLKWTCITVAVVLLATATATVVVAVAVVPGLLFSTSTSSMTTITRKVAVPVVACVVAAGVVAGVGVAAQKGIEALTYNDKAYHLQQEESPDKEMMAPMFRRAASANK